MYQLIIDCSSRKRNSLIKVAYPISSHPIHSRIGDQAAWIIEVDGVVQDIGIEVDAACEPDGIALGVISETRRGNHSGGADFLMHSGVLPSRFPDAVP